MDALIITAANWQRYEAEIGGKARGLFFLQEKGFDVPQFFAVRDLPATDHNDLQESLAQQTAVDPEDMLYAVRSSGAAEDSADRSFAGLFESFLFVKKAELARHVELCRRSGNAERVRVYGDAQACMPVCVVVQHMIKSPAAGVLFTANPAGALTQTVIAAAYGLGEGVVQDRVETDTYILDRATGELRMETAHKTSMMCCDEAAGSGVCSKPVAPGSAGMPVLTEAEARSLASIGADIARLYPKHFLDIEWCLDGQRQVRILQCRPITSIPSGEFTVIDNSNIVEGYPGISQALTFSIVKDGYRKNVSALLRELGIPEAKIAAARRQLEHMVAYVEGRVYYNLTSWYRVFGLVPGFGSSIVPLFEAMIGVVQEGRTETARPALRHTPIYARIASRLAPRFLFHGQRMRRYKQAFAALEAQVRAQRLEALSSHELVDLWLHVDTRIFQLIHIALLNDLFLMVLVAAAKSMLCRAGLPDADSLFNALMCGEQGMESVLPVRSIARLAEQARSQPVLLQALRQAVASGEQHSLESALSLAPAFAENFYKHIERYGDRLPQELKIETESFRENPLLLAAAVIRQAEGGMTVAGLRERELAIRQEADARLAAGLSWQPLRRLTANFLLRKTRQALAHRESARLDRARSMGMFRSLARALGAGLCREGAIAAAFDICHLTFDEIKDYIMGSSAATDLKAVIARRKDDLAKFACRAPADRMILRGTLCRNFIVQNGQAGHQPANRDEAGSLLLQGIPSSPGTVTAEAVFVDDPATAPAAAGKIIVARMTDPGWVFLMAAAAGLIVERGSLLSHTAIIGRELGIPTIVGATGACELISTGLPVTMDGSTGRIIQTCQKPG